MDVLEYVRDGEVALINLCQPRTLNALSIEMAQRLLSSLRDADEDPDARVVVISGKGAFCSGIELAELDQVGSGKRWDGLETLVVKVFIPVVEQLWSMRKPTIARIEGVAAGAGMSLALACDFRYGGASAKFVPGFARLGLVPDCGGTWLLPRVVGVAKAFEINLLRSVIEASEAKQLGLLTWISDRADDEEAFDECLRTVISLPRLAVVNARNLLALGPGRDLRSALRAEAAAMGELGKTDDFQEGVLALKEKRPPVFRG